MKAVVLCGGKGTRLRPYTEEVPKPMLPLGQKPILQYVIENGKRAGITDFYLTVGYLKEQIMDYFKDGKQFGVNIHYVVEQDPQNTAGSILPLKEELREPFFVLMGDHLTNINLKDMYAFHTSNHAFATLALKEQKKKLEYGVVELNDGKEILGFKEKPVVSHYINTAIYLFQPQVFQYIQPKEDFGKDVLPRMLKHRERVLGYVFKEFWMDVGRVTDYEKLHDFITIVELVSSFG